MGMIVISLVLSLVFLAAVSAIARSRFGTAGVCGLAALGTLLCLSIFSASIALQAFLTVIVSLACLPFRATPRVVTWAAVGAMVVSYAYIVSLSFSELRELSRLRKKFPIESLASRLAYEPNDAGTAPEDSNTQRPHLSPSVEKRLTRFEGDFHTNIRRYMLTSLHDRTRDEFVMARGFGPVRMLSVRSEKVELPKFAPIPLPLPPEPAYEPDQGSSVPPAGEEMPTVIVPPENALASMHDSGIEDFFDPERMGYVKDREHVAGFYSHRFTITPELAAPKDEPPAWQIVRLELVSLLKHDTPAAYVSKNLPQMDELREAPTRPLDRFEQQAIERLRADEDVVIDETPDRIRMVGSLRAAKDCLKCHSVRRGDLLGALTYELVPLRPTRKQGPQISPPSS